MISGAEEGMPSRSPYPSKPQDREPSRRGHSVRPEMDLAGIPAQTEAELIDGLWAVYNTKLVNSEWMRV